VSQSQTIRIVSLPDRRHVVELQTDHYGGSEIQSTYAYFRQGEEVHANELALFKRDYWGRIEGVSVVLQPSLLEIARNLSREITR
jgi:hypothetical protein